MIVFFNNVIICNDKRKIYTINFVDSFGVVVSPPNEWYNNNEYTPTLYASQIKMEQNYRIFILTLFLMTFLSGCKNYQNEMFDWSSSIPIGTNLEAVKKDQPDFLEIDWENPDILDNDMTRYSVTKIKWNYDILKMSYFLEFKNNGFRGLFGHK